MFGGMIGINGASKQTKTKPSVFLFSAAIRIVRRICDREAGRNKGYDQQSAGYPALFIDASLAAKVYNLDSKSGFDPASGLGICGDLVCRQLPQPDPGP